MRDVSWEMRNFSSASERSWVPKKSRFLELFCEKICEDEELKKFGLSKDNIVPRYDNEALERLFEELESYSVLIRGKPMSGYEYFDFCRHVRELKHSMDYYRSIFLPWAIKYSLHLTTKEQYEEIDKIKSLVSAYMGNFGKIAFPYEEAKEEEKEQSSVKEEEAKEEEKEQSSVKEEEPSDGDVALFIFGACFIYFCLYCYA